ncbi:MAG: sugar ABC transporter permease [Firmicutes bacterium]|nr:sugar ABC transporter permease [Bacillota bacterium]
MAKKQGIGIQKRSYIGLLYILPWLLGFSILQLYPFVVSFIYSFTNLKIAGSFKFVGLDNYIQLFTKDPDFLNSMAVTLKYVLYVVPGKIICALIVAMVLNMKLKVINLYRTIYYLPSILGGSVAISVLWRVMFMKSGIVNSFTAYMGIPALNWLSDMKYALFTISLIEIWQFGSSMVIFLAALKQVPSEMYDAARVDGAKKFRTFFNVTLPMISPVMFFNILMQTINALQNFTAAFVVTKGGPVKSTYLIGLKLYEDAFSKYRMGYASAGSWIVFTFIVLFTVFLFKSSNLWVFYNDGRK